MSDENLKALKEKVSGDSKPHDLVQPVEYNGGHRKEIEVIIKDGKLCIAYISNIAEW